MIRCALLLLSFFFVVFSSGANALPGESFTNKQWSADIVPLPQEDAKGNNAIVALRKNGVPVLEAPTEGYLLNVLWSPSGDFVAINNRTSNSGDYLWVASMKDKKWLKKPLEEIPFKRKELPSEFKEAEMFRQFLTATGWTRDEMLIVEEKSYFRNKQRFIIYKLTCSVGVTLSVREQDLLVEDRSK